MATKESIAEIKEANDTADVHHMVRRVGERMAEDGSITADVADAHVRTWLQAGYRLAFVQALGLEHNGVNILYIFVKD